jgi:hypothetical protein
MDEKRREEVREGVNDADDTGLIGGEELITQAETMLPLLRPEPLPREDLHAALPDDHSAHDAIDHLHREIESDAPDRGKIEEHVAHLRGLPELEAIVVNWWENPSTQRFFAALGQIGV